MLQSVLAQTGRALALAQSQVQRRWHPERRERKLAQRRSEPWLQVACSSQLQGLKMCARARLAASPRQTLGQRTTVNPDSFTQLPQQPKP